MSETIRDAQRERGSLDRHYLGTARIGGVLRVCPACLRRYTDAFPECPVDGSSLERIPLYERLPNEPPAPPIRFASSLKSIYPTGVFPRICEACGVSTFTLATEADGTRVCPPCYVKRNP